MKKFSICLVCISIAFAVSGCSKLSFNKSVLSVLPDCDREETYYSDGFQDYTDFCKYYYSDDKIIEDIKKSFYFNELDDSNMQRVNSFFNDFEGWVAHEDFYDEYDFSTDCINNGDYYSLYIPEHLRESNENYYSYSMFYFDCESMILYYIHNNI